MSTGAGIIWSTLIVLLTIGIWRATINNRWKAVGKAALWLLVICMLTGAAIWAWAKFQDQPEVATSLAGATIGMSSTDVKLALGRPDQWGLPTAESRIRYVYRRDYNRNYWLLVSFEGAEGDSKANVICEHEGSNKLLGIGRFSGEDELIDQLGAWPERSIARSGLQQVVSYPKWKVSYILEKGTVVGLCVSEDGNVTYEGDSPTFRPWVRFDPTTAKPAVISEVPE